MRKHGFPAQMYANSPCSLTSMQPLITPFSKLQIDLLMHAFNPGIAPNLDGKQVIFPRP